jgi:hypothetical protein
MTLRELSARLDAYLKAFEADGLLDLHNAGAYYMGGARIRLTYRSYEGGTTISRPKAEAYLAWLDAGGIGRHLDRVQPNRSASTVRLDGPAVNR